MAPKIDPESGGLPEAAGAPQKQTEARNRSQKDSKNAPRAPGSEVYYFLTSLGPGDRQGPGATGGRGGWPRRGGQGRPGTARHGQARPGEAPNQNQQMTEQTNINIQSHS